MKEIKIDSFYKGILDDERIQDGAGFSFAYNFDIFSNPLKLIPYHSLTKNLGTPTSTWDVRKLLIDKSGYVYGLGRVSTSYNRPKILKSDSLDSVSWSAPANGECSSGARNGELFSIYKDYIYTFSGTNQLDKFGPLSGTPSYTTNHKTFSANVSVTAPGIIGKDDNLYIPYRKSDSTQTGLARWDGTTLTEGAITLPSNLTIVQCAWYGSYCAIACYPDNASENSIIYLWDWLAPDVTEAITVSQDKIYGVANFEGSLVALTSNSGSSGNLNPKATIWQYNGVSMAIIKELSATPQFSGAAMTVQSPLKVFRNKLYFAVSATLPSTTNTKYIVELSRKSSVYPLAMTIGMYDSNIGTTTNDRIYDFIYQNDKIMLSYYKASDETDILSSTNFYAVYRPAVYETQIITGDDPSVLKQIMAVSLQFAPLPSYATVKLSYKKDEETSWTEIFTDGTDSAVSHEAVNIESTGASLPQFKEIKFRIESTNGACITGLKFKYEELNGLY